MTNIDSLTKLQHVPGAEVVFGDLAEKISMQPVSEGVDFAYERTISDTSSGFCALWAADPGIYPRVKDRRGSAMYILSGDATVFDKDGTAHELTEGSSLVLPYRWEGRWEIRRTIRKVYIYSWPQGEPSTTPVPAASLGGVEAFHGELSTPLPGSQHQGGLPDARAQVITDDVDGLCAIVGLDSSGIVADASPRASYLQVLTGTAEVSTEGGESVSVTPGSTLVLPAGWRGEWAVTSPLRMFAFFTDPRVSDEPN